MQNSKASSPEMSVICYLMWRLPDFSTTPPQELSISIHHISQWRNILSFFGGGSLTLLLLLFLRQFIRNPLILAVFCSPGGTGKTSTTGAFKGFLHLRSKNVVAVGTTAVAAQLLLEGIAAHFTIKIPILCNESDTRIVPGGRHLPTDFQIVASIVFDESLIRPRYCFHTVRHTK